MSTSAPPLGRRYTRAELLSETVDVRRVLASRGAPEYRVLMSKRRTEHDKELARCGRFVVFPTVEVATCLKPPVDWTQDPLSSRSWRAQLHSLRFLDVLFQMYLEDDDREALDSAGALAVDWIAHNRQASPGISEYAWFDRLVGDRAPYLAYLLVTSAAAGRLSATAAQSLLASVIEHADFLADDANYVGGTNHGLFQDAGLLLITSYLPFLDEAQRWRGIATERFFGTLSRHVDHGEAIHLEHSPSYHTDITALTEKIIRLAEVDDARLGHLVDRLTDNSGWFVMPDGNLPPLGDTDLSSAPAFARSSAESKQGLRLFPASGWAVVKDDDSYLILTAAFHSRAHKHSDELSFCLVDRGELVITEAGKYGYDEDEAREYATSSRGHNVVLVDDDEFSFRWAKPYGSGVRRGGAAGGWYAVEATNQLLRARGVVHRRTLLFRPRVVLIVVDEMSADESHTYTRLFHIGPDIQVTRNNGCFHLVGNDFAGSLADAGGEPVRQRVTRGETSPRLKGWTFPRYGVSCETAVVELVSVGAASTLATVIGLMPDPIETHLAPVETGGFTVELRHPQVEASVVVTPDDERLLLGVEACP